MRRAWLLLAALVLSAPTGRGGGFDPGLAAPGFAPAFSFAYPGTYAGYPVPYQGLPNKGAPGCYAASLITGTKGEALTFTRATASSCPTSADGSTLQQCASGEACITYAGAAGTAVGLRVWRNYVELILRTEELNDAAWSTAAGVGSVTVTANAAAAPDGTPTAERLQVDYPSIGETVRYQGVATAAGQCTASVWVLGNGQSKTIDLGTFSGTYVNTACTYNATTPVRCTHTRTCAAGTSYFILGCEHQGTTNCTTGNVKDFFAWGANFTETPYAAPYVKATSAAVTVNDEIASFTATVPEQPGSFSAFVSHSTTAPTAGGGVVAKVRTSATDYSVAGWLVASMTTLNCSAVGAGAETRSTTTLDGTDQIACYVDTGGIAACIGGTCTTQSGGDPGLSANGTTISLGYDPDNADYEIDGVISNVCADADPLRCR